MSGAGALVGEVEVHADAAALARAAAEDFTSRARAAVERSGRFSVALTGGSSPVALYRLLASPPFADRIPWRGVHLFWGDDRAVPPDHPRSNFRLANRLFIGPLGLEERNVHRIRGELGERRAAELYAAELAEFFPGRPAFDLVYLGLGDDGHVASLFPFDLPRLLERERSVVSALYRDLGEWRVTLTYPVLRAAHIVEFLIGAPDKAPIACAAIRGPLDPLRIPAQGIRPVDGRLLWRVSRPVADRCGLDARGP